MGDHLPSEHHQGLLLLRREPFRNPIDDTERSEGMPIPVDEGDTGIKSNMRLSGHQRIGRKPDISERVRHFEQISLQDGVRTKGDIARGLTDSYAGLGFEPLTEGINQTDQRDRHLTDLRG